MIFPFFEVQKWVQKSCIRLQPYYRTQIENVQWNKINQESQATKEEQQGVRK